MPPPYQWACYQIVGLLHGIQLDKVYVTSANKLLTIARFVIRLIYILTESFRILFVIFWYYKAIEVLNGSSQKHLSEVFKSLSFSAK